MTNPSGSSIVELPVIAVVRDLIFRSKIESAARAAEAKVLALRDPERLGTRAARRILVDLNQPGVLDAAIAWKRSTGGEVVGFVSHVETYLISAAKAAGVDRVLARSEFVRILDELIC